MKITCKKLLIVGECAIATRLAKVLSKNKELEKIYVTSCTSKKSDDKIEYLDIREDDVTELLSFAITNSIDLTIPCSIKTIKSDIVSFFQSNEQNIYGPSKNAGKIVWDNVYAKKFLYKIHAQTSQFSVFDKIQYAIDYLKNAKYPVLIRTQEYNGVEDRLVASTIDLARDFLEKLFSNNETNILVEEFTQGHNFTLYFVTDGYTAIPITTVANYKFMADGDSGIYTNGVGCYSPDYKISQNTIGQLHKIVLNTLNSLRNRNNEYVGILGVNCTLKDEKNFVVNEFYNFFQQHDVTAILNTFEDDFLNIAFDCINGLFSDEYEGIKTNDLCSVSCVVNSKKASENLFVEDILDVDIFGLKLVEDTYLTTVGKQFAITKTSSTLNSAKTRLYNELDDINCKYLQYRKDIGKTIEDY